MTRAQRIGVRIVKARRYRGLSQTDLAKKIGGSQRMVSRWETGKELPSPIEIVGLAIVLGVPPRALMPVR